MQGSLAQLRQALEQCGTTVPSVELLRKLHGQIEQLEQATVEARSKCVEKQQSIRSGLEQLAQKQEQQRKEHEERERQALREQQERERREKEERERLDRERTERERERERLEQLEKERLERLEQERRERELQLQRQREHELQQQPFNRTQMWKSIHEPAPAAPLDEIRPPSNPIRTDDQTKIEVFWKNLDAYFAPITESDLFTLIDEPGYGDCFNIPQLGERHKLKLNSSATSTTTANMQSTSTASGVGANKLKFVSSTNRNVGGSGSGSGSGSGQTQLTTRLLSALVHEGVVDVNSGIDDINNMDDTEAMDIDQSSEQHQQQQQQQQQLQQLHGATGLHNNEQIQSAINRRLRSELESLGLIKSDRVKSESVVNGPLFEDDSVTSSNNASPANVLIQDQPPLASAHSLLNVVDNNSSNTNNDNQVCNEWFANQDDEICVEIRHLQHQLRDQMYANRLRRRRLYDLAIQQMGYEGYRNILDEVERNLDIGFKQFALVAKRVNSNIRKKRKLNPSASGHQSNTPGPMGSRMGSEAPMSYDGLSQQQQTSATPAVVSDRHPVPENLLQLMRQRKQLIDSLGKLFTAEKFSTPTESIYKDLDLTPPAEFGLNVDDMGFKNTIVPEHEYQYLRKQYNTATSQTLTHHSVAKRRSQYEY
ncbi:hypothetical protein GQ42DRAFT_180731 [Ramicandelaber brevisporus]|nr:hypothetical protein GQ42DRAFT_180731 [Ramicandelaber brevisporus]